MARARGAAEAEAAYREGRFWKGAPSLGQLLTTLQRKGAASPHPGCGYAKYACTARAAVYAPERPNEAATNRSRWGNMSVVSHLHIHAAEGNHTAGANLHTAADQVRNSGLCARAGLAGSLPNGSLVSQHFCGYPRANKMLASRKQQTAHLGDRTCMRFSDFPWTIDSWRGNPSRQL